MSGIHTNIAIGIPHCGRPITLEWSLRLPTINWPLGTNVTWIGLYDDPSLPAAERLQKVREDIVLEARNHTPKYLWLIDDDTEPPVHAARYLIRELERSPSVAICAGIYGTKESEPQPMVWREKGDLPATFSPGEVFPCEQIATGCMMIRMSVFDELPRPWFRMRDDDCVYSTREREVIFSDSQGEDMYFCESVRRLGYTILAHGGVLATHWDPYTHRAYRLPEIVKVELASRFAGAMR